MKIIREELKLKTQNSQEFLEITDSLRELVKKSGILSGTLTVYSPHTTAAVMINENADPDVLDDLILGLNTAFPENPQFEHMEGNSTAHLKSICVGNNETILLHNGFMELGIWQGVFFCEFDGPRERRLIVQIAGLGV